MIQSPEKKIDLKHLLKIYNFLPDDTFQQVHPSNSAQEPKYLNSYRRTSHKHDLFQYKFYI